MADGLSVMEILQEMRVEISDLKTSFADFKGRVVMKEELEMWQEAQRTTRRWAIGTIISILGIGVVAVGVIASMSP